MGGFPVQLGDKTYRWRLRWKDAKEIENCLEQLHKTKVNWISFRTQMQSWTVDEFAIVLWAGLRHEAPNLTVVEVLELADWTIMDSFTAAMAEELVAAIPEKYRRQTENPQKAEAPN